MQSVEQWINAAPSPIAQIRRRQLFQESDDLLAHINRQNGIDAPLPEIRITDSGYIQAEATSWVIYIDKRLLDLCLAADGQFADEMLPQHCNMRFEKYDAIAWIGLLWILAHEYFHVIRKHQEIGAHRVDVMATEKDADMCATALVFRRMQALLGPDATERDVAVNAAYYLSWLFWRLPRAAASSAMSSHPSHLDRLWFLVIKLSTLTLDGANRNDPSSDGFGEGFQVSVEVFVIFAKAERFCTGSIDVCSQVGEYAESRQWSPLVRRWHELAPEVERISGTTAVTRLRSTRPDPK